MIIFSNDPELQDDGLLMHNYGLINHYDHDIISFATGSDDGGIAKKPVQDSFVMEDKEIVHFVIPHSHRRQSTDIFDSPCDCLLEHVVQSNYGPLCELIKNSQR